MKPVLFSPAAEGDIEAIWDYSADNWGPDQADCYTDNIRDICIALAQGSRQGRSADARPGYLKVPAGSHMIYFRDRDECLEIIRILHGRQDVDRNL